MTEGPNEEGEMGEDGRMVLTVAMRDGREESFTSSKLMSHKYYESESGHTRTCLWRQRTYAYSVLDYDGALIVWEIQQEPVDRLDPKVVARREVARFRAGLWDYARES